MSQAAAGHLRVSERNIMYDYPCGVTSNFFFFYIFIQLNCFPSCMQEVMCSLSRLHSGEQSAQLSYQREKKTRVHYCSPACVTVVNFKQQK